MAAEPHDHDGSLEARVTRLEQRVDQQLEHKIDSVGYGLSLTHEEVREVRRKQDEHSLLLESHGEMLREILRRLPPPADDSGN